MHHILYVVLVKLNCNTASAMAEQTDTNPAGNFAKGSSAYSFSAIDP